MNSVFMSGVRFRCTSSFSHPGVIMPVFFLLSFFFFLNQAFVFCARVPSLEGKKEPSLLRRRTCFFPPIAVSWMKINEKALPLSVPRHWGSLGNSIKGTHPEPSSITFASYGQWFHSGLSLCSYLTHQAGRACVVFGRFPCSADQPASYLAAAAASSDRDELLLKRLARTLR